jgi:hypothetical protein
MKEMSAGKYKDTVPDTLLDKSVKLAFKATNVLTKQEITVDLWVKVESLSCQDDELLGTLCEVAVYPFLIKEKQGSWIPFRMEEILDIWSEH